jgi:mRNA interferase MazF
MKRGDVVLVTAPGDYGKRRPAVVVQTDLLNATHASIVVTLITSDLQDAPLFRLTLEPGGTTGLRVRSQIMVDKVVTVRRERIAGIIGRLPQQSLLHLNRSLAFVLSLAG